MFEALLRFSQKVGMVDLLASEVAIRERRPRSTPMGVFVEGSAVG